MAVTQAVPIVQSLPKRMVDHRVRCKLVVYLSDVHIIFDGSLTQFMAALILKTFVVLNQKIIATVCLIKHCPTDTATRTDGRCAAKH